MKKIKISVALLLGLSFLVSCETENTYDNTSSSKSATINSIVTPKKFLFDAKKAETAGNADWVLDADTSPQRYPTPLQNTITASTPENYWKGALSSWGIALVKMGHTVETLPSTVSITYGGTGAQDLKNYDVCP